MKIGDPGPRDWAASDEQIRASFSRSRRQSSLFDDDAGVPRGPDAPVFSSFHLPNGHGKLLSWLSLLFGGCALVIALVQPRGTGIGIGQGGYILSALGIFAIWFGVRALRQHRAGLPAATMLARVGIVFGTIGTAVTAYAVVGVLLSLAGVALPALPSLASPGVSPNGLVLGGMAPQQPTDDLGAVQAPGIEAPYAPDPSQTELQDLYDAAWAEQDTLCTALSTFEWELHNIATAAPPTGEVMLAEDGVTLVTSSGLRLAEVPFGTRVDFARGSFEGEFVITLTGSEHASVVWLHSVLGLSGECYV